MFCAPGIVFGGSECVGSRLHIFRSHTLFQRFQRPRFQVLCFGESDSFSAVSRASGPILMFCDTRLVFDDTEVIGSRFHFLCFRSHFRRCLGRRVQFLCFALLDSCSAVPRASGPVFMFCDHGLIFGGSESGRVFIFCAPGLIFGGSEVFGSRFYVLRCRSHFCRYRARRVEFSCFALPDSFSTVARVSVPFSYFALPDSFSAVARASGPVFMFCAPELMFCVTEGVGTNFHVLNSRTRFRRYRGRRVPFSRFTSPNSFSAVSRASSLDFMFALQNSFSAAPRASGQVSMFCSPGRKYVYLWGQNF
jgi:hypothetical protein